MRPSWRSFLSFPKIIPVALLLTVFLYLPSAKTGLLFDDYFFIQAAEGGTHSPGRVIDHYIYADGHAVRDAWASAGTYPWWMLPDLKIAFFRPLASALMSLDVKLFGRQAWGYRLSTFIWYLGLVGVAGLVLRELLPGTLGALALLLFTVHPCHAMPALWLSNRHSCISSAAALLALYFHLRWRLKGWQAGRWAAVGCTAIAFGAGEASLSALCFLFFWEAFCVRPGSSLRELWPYALLAMGYGMIYVVFGYGTHGSGAYVNPVSEPAAFFTHLPQRFAALLAGLCLDIPFDLYLNPLLNGTLLVAGAGAGTIMGWLLFRKGGPGPEILAPSLKKALFWGTIFSMVPLASAIPSSRLLLASSFGSSVLIAVLILQGSRYIARPLALLHLLFAPLALVVQLLLVQQLGQRCQQLSQIPALDDRKLPQQVVFVVHSPDIFTTFVPAIQRQFEGAARPRAWWVLSASPQTLELKRLGAASLELRSVEGDMLLSPHEVVTRGPEHRLKTGERLRFPGMTVEVAEMGSQGPRCLRYEFECPLEDPCQVFLNWEDGRFVPMKFPPQGRTVLLPFEKGIFPLS